MKRQAFTLVEMLVSLALVLFIMVILSQALSTGLETFRQLKSTGELDEKLRMASTILRQDLELDHFEGKRRLSDPSFWIQGPPRAGFFHIEQLAKSQLEGRDGDQIPSWLATHHRLHFSIKMRGSQRESFLSAVVPAHSPLLAANTTYFGFPADARYQDTPSTYTSQWAEVTYFLMPNGASAGGTPLFGLYRRQRLAVPNNLDLNWGASRVPVPNPMAAPQLLSAYASMSCAVAPGGSSLYFNSPTDLTVPERRYGVSRVALPDPRNPSLLVSNYAPLGTGEDLLLTDVVSFSVRILSPDVLNQSSSPARPYDHVDDPADGPNTFVDLPPIPGFGGFVNGTALTAPIGAFDTWSSVQDETYNYYGTQAPLPIRINALQITLRVYDAKTQQTRQITIVEAM
jgi:prepilin-type N-terminal cleavage/methylation domain-containing protein